MLRRTVLVFGAAFLVCLALVGAWLWSASPGPRSQDITGVGIGRYDGRGGIAYLSGRRLSCEALSPTVAYTSRCTITIAGRPLVIDARRNAPPNMDQLGGACAATYAGRAWPCEVDSRHVGVHWFAFIEQPLGLEPPALDALRRQFVVENLPEHVFVRGIPIVAVATALVALAASVVVLQPMLRERWEVGATSLAYSTIGLALGAVFALWATGGFWD